jgi:hypothetical protein
MATEAQIAANRRNAQLSSGPKTQAGKNVSRMNALRHGLTQQIEVMTPEEKEAYLGTDTVLLVRRAVIARNPPRPGRDLSPSGASLVLRLLIPRAALELSESTMVVPCSWRRFGY